MGFWNLAPRPEGSTSLVDDMIEVADDLRQLYTDFGLRHRRAFLVWIGWTPDVDGDGAVSSKPIVREGMAPDEALEAMAEVDLDADSVGVGRPVLLCEVEVLPTPVVLIGGIGKDQDAVGLTERGSATASQVSMRLSEDLLMGLVAPFRDPERADLLKPGIEFFWEVVEDRPAGYVAPGFAGSGSEQERPPPRRRFHVAGTPEREPDRFGWSVPLRRADGERGRDGDVEAVDGGPFDDEE